jgi:rhamnose utilization protein RhaD (predicted bifunctional aldolase and dehydrogenase)
MSLKEIAKISREFGSDERYVLAGGGNTSFKDTESLYIKASGYSLAVIEEDGFVRMEREKLQRIWTTEYPDDVAQRESKALVDLMDSRAAGEEDKRPSVETLLHEAIPQTFVVHTHPSLVNGLTCSQEGAAASSKLFGDSAIWIPLVNPGYILAATVRDELQKYSNTVGGSPDFILLQNHGVFVAADTTGGIRTLYEKLFRTLDAALVRRPDDGEVRTDTKVVEGLTDRITEGFKAATPENPVHTSFQSNNEVMRIIRDEQSFIPVSSAYTPDQIVYCGHKPLLVGGAHAIDDVSTLIGGYLEAEGVLPKLIAITGVGVVGCGRTEKAAENAALLFGDGAKISVYAESFGGHRFMPQDQIDFIRGWEVENYRSKIGS